VGLADPPVVDRPRVDTPPASSLRRPASTRDGIGDPARSWLRLVLFGAALLVAFAGLRVTLQEWWWFLAVALAVGLLLLAIGVVRQLATRGWQPLLAGVAVGVVTLTFGFARDESLVGVIPTLDTLRRWVELANEGSRSIASQRLPAVADERIVFLLVVLAVVAAGAVAPAIDRVPALAAVPLLVVLDVPVAVRAGIAEPLWYVVTAALYLALLRVGRRGAPLGGIAVVATLTIVGSLVLPAAFPPARQPVRDSGGALGTGLNPIINLGEDLRREFTVDALTYTTDAPGGLYLRLATLDRFSGLSWEPDSAGIEPTFDVAEFPPPPGLTDEVPRYEYSVDVAVEEVTGRWLPVPYPALSVEGLDGIWNWEPDGLAVRSGGANVGGQQYTVRFLDVEPDRDQLLADLEPDVPSRYLDLPEELPAIITDTAQQVAGSGTAYERAIALQEYFTGPEFEYSLDAPVEGDFDGTGLGVLERFLEAKSGYCVHYASAMAVLARALDIPSRVVVGFQPGSADASGRTFTVTSGDLHAWPELYFEGIGWLRFEPTPGRGAPPGYSSIDAVDDPETPEFEGVNPSAAPVPQNTAAPSLPPEEEVVDDGGQATNRPFDPAPVVAIVVLAVVGVLLTPALVRAGTRARRLRRVREESDAEAAWAEVRDTARDHDWTAPETETPRQLGERLAIVVGDDAVARLRGGVETAAFAPPGRPAMSAQDVVALRGAIASAATLRVRFRATFLPPSLLDRYNVRRPSAG
jgi:Transglutaminase-like enzymes, putative cysteine proteases